MDSPPQTAQQAAQQAASVNGTVPTPSEDAALLAARVAETARSVQAITDQLAVLQLELGVLVGLSLLILTLQVVRGKRAPA